MEYIKEDRIINILQYLVIVVLFLFAILTMSTTYKATQLEEEMNSKTTQNAGH